MQSFSCLYSNNTKILTELLKFFVHGLSVPEMKAHNIIIIRSIFSVVLGLPISVIFCQNNFLEQQVRTQMSDQQFESQLPTLILFPSCCLGLRKPLSTEKQCMEAHEV